MLAEWHFLALNAALLDVAKIEISREDHMSMYNGLPTKRKLQILSDKGLVNSKDFSKIFDLKQKFTIDFIEKLAFVDEVKISMLERLRQDGFLLSCVTNSIKYTAELMLSKTGQIKYFHTIITNEDVVFSKPHPQGYLKAIDLLGTSPLCTLIVEDSEKGCESAINSKSNLWKVSGIADVFYGNICKILEKYND
ncbi:MAG: HAD family phosphatase [Richelia sp. RM2_1_2]|nr:HAD family phosphatase [Richelia sp. RM2_1_2]